MENHRLYYSYECGIDYNLGIRITNSTGHIRLDNDWYNKMAIAVITYVDNNSGNSTNYGSRLRVHGSEDEQAYWDEFFDD